MIAELLRLLAVAAIPLAVGSFAVALRGPGEALRQKMKTDAEILSLLPAESSARRTMLGILDEEAERLKENQHVQRDLLSSLAGFSLYSIFALVTINFWGHKDWWIGALAILTGVLGLASLFMMIEGLKLKHRLPKSSGHSQADS